MAETQRVGDLEIEQNLPYQRRMWRVERAGWIVMLLVGIGALLGLFGSGPLSNATAGSPGGPLQLEYNRFWRAHHSTVLHLQVRPAPGSREVRVWLDQAYLNQMQIEQITPEPVQSEAGAGRTWFVFAVAPGAAQATIDVYLRPSRMGNFASEAGVEEAAVPFRQIIYP